MGQEVSPLFYTCTTLARGLAGDHFQITVERNHSSDAEITGKFGGESQGPLLPAQWREETLQAVLLLI